MRKFCAKRHLANCWKQTGWGPAADPQGVEQHSLRPPPSTWIILRHRKRREKVNHVSFLKGKLFTVAKYKAWRSQSDMHICKIIALHHTANNLVKNFKIMKITCQMLIKCCSDFQKRCHSPNVQFRVPLRHTSSLPLWNPPPGFTNNTHD